MAIEFNCPYCTAAIRVPDEYSGKQGSCPKCGTKLIVPDVVPKAPVTESPQTPPVAPAAYGQPPANPQPAPQFAQQPPPVQQPYSQPVSPGGIPNAASQPQQHYSPETAPTGFQQPVPHAPGTPVSPAATPSVSKSMRKKNRRKRKQGNWSFVVAILCFIIFFGVVAVIVTMKKPELKGTLQASIAHKNALPPSRIHFATLNLTGEEATNAANAFKEAKESFLSPQMTCSLEASDTELSIVIRPSGEGVWYTVSPSSDANLMNWIRSNRDSILSAKRERMISTGTEMCRDKILKNSGETLAFNPARYRDDFALNSCVDAFGYSIVAIANKKMSPCCYEDPNGLLYFCLPEGTTSFQIRGRDFEGSRWFPGTYQVTVDVASTASPAAEAPAPAIDDKEDWDPLQPAPGSFPAADDEMETPDTDMTDEKM